MDLDPQVRQWLDAFPPPDADAPQPTLEEMRRAGDEWPWGERPEVFASVDGVVTGSGGDIPVRIYRPNADHSLPAIVFLHGGGWVVGSIELVDGMCRRLTNDVGAVVVSVEYRLAPEHPFPQPLDDVVDVVRWVASSPGLGVDVSRIAIVGESAGGNLAACSALRLADEGGPRLVHQTLMYPVLDHDFARPSMIRAEQGFGLTRDSMEWFWDQYVPDPGRRDDPYVAPGNAEPHRLSRVAPATIVTAGFDPLCDEGDEYADLLAQAGVPVTHLRYEGQIHGFVAVGDVFDDALGAWTQITDQLKQAFHSS